MTTNNTAVKACDHASVGVLLRDPDGSVLLIKRGTWPPGWAGIAGHVYDNHPGYMEAAVAVAHEEVGVHLAYAQLGDRATTGGWRDNQCRRQPCVIPADGTGRHCCPYIGHDWAVWVIDLDHRPALDLSERETAGHLWATPHDLGYLMGRTIARAHGLIDDQEWAAHPGLEPVWLRWLVNATILDLPDSILDQVELRLNP